VVWQLSSFQGRKVEGVGFSVEAEGRSVAAVGGGDPGAASVGVLLLRSPGKE